MTLNIIIGLLYFCIAGMFAYNFNVIVQRIRHGSKKVNKYSLFATSSLVLIFFAEFLNRFGLGSEWVLLAQGYLLWTMLYILNNKKKEEEKK